ncbi:hypothetical protein [Paenibacillus glycanilyticus]|uniref:Uncharacterized protein n=1 Tax=Paenibacillus glycanilyticus TaxID=126569 RepID=A0ABQ6G7R6_9BACL|nr:hypothetical protein [Paenibacillus glycanilyticus]GLX67021.1 hypothetical protein MU1_13650 [Paenibacillus glycanilyticus]
MKNDIAKFLEISEEIEEEYRKKRTIFEDNHGELKKFVHNGIKINNNIAKAPKTCMFPNCSNETIKRSHTIQSSASLSLIAESNHVLQPNWNDFDAKYYMKKVGINEASVFTGFCKDHEQIFNFEKKKLINEEFDIILQVFRTICREVVNIKNVVLTLEKVVENYKKIRQDKMLANIESKLEKPVKSIGIQKYTVDLTDETSHVYNLQLKECTKRLNEFKSFYTHATTDVLNKQVNKLSYTAIKFDQFFPVSLAGVASFSKKNGKKVIFIINILPYEDGTLMLAATSKKEKYYLEKYQNHFSQHPLMLLNMVESWMVHGSDHWFIKPSEWYKHPIEKQEKILNDLYVTEKNIFSNYDLSIFDDLRTKFIIQPYNISNDDYSDSLKNLIDIEKEKLKISPYFIKPTSLHRYEYWMKNQ